MPPRPSRARAFFDGIQSAEDILRLTDPVQASSEEEWLDCKADPLSDPRMVKASAKDREAKLKSIWYEALSGFANSGDGVLIWGLDARKGPDGRDAIRETVPVDNPAALRSRLMELHRGGTDTPLSGVEVRAYEDRPGSGKGYVVCFVPEGAFKPYRAEIKDAKQYFIRAGDHFGVAPTSLLRTLFYPRALARLEVTADVRWELLQVRGQGAAFACDFQAKNKGPASARELEITVATPHALKNLGSRHPTGKWVPYTLEDGTWLFHLQRVLHSGAPTGVFGLKWNVPELFAAGDRVLPRGPDIDFRLSLYAENQPPQYARFQFGMEELTSPLGAGRATRIVTAEETQPW